MPGDVHARLSPHAPVCKYFTQMENWTTIYGLTHINFQIFYYVIDAEFLLIYCSVKMNEQVDDIFRIKDNIRQLKSNVTTLLINPGD